MEVTLMSQRPNNPYDEAPAAWRLWQWVVAHIPREDVREFAAVMAGYRDEARTEATSDVAMRELTLPQVTALHQLTGQIIAQAQRESWEAAGRCGTCGFDGDRTNCRDCQDVAAPATQVSGS